MSRTLTAVLVVAIASAAWAVVKKPAEPSTDPDVSYRYPVVSAPLLTGEPPKIDGVIEKAEWTHAGRSLPFVSMSSGAAAEDRAECWIAYTHEAIYVAFRFDRPTYADLPHSSDAHDKVWGDDSLELFLRPKPGTREEFNFVINAKGVRAEGLRTGSTNKGWDVEWSGAARMLEHGYEGELRVPFASLGLQAPQPGEVWEMLAVNARHTPSMDLGVSSYMKHWTAMEDFGFLVFSDDAAPVVNPIEAGALSTQDAGILLELLGRQTDTRVVKVRAELWRSKVTDPYFTLMESEANPLGPQVENRLAELIPAEKVATATLARYEPVQRWEEDVEVAGGQVRRVPWNVAVPTGDYVLHYRAIDSQNNALLSAGTLPFRQLPAFVVEVEPYLLVAKCVAIVCDYRRVSDVPADASLTARLLDASGAVVEQASMPIDQAARRSVLRLPSEKRMGQEYTLDVKLVAGGRAVAEHTQPVSLPKAPEWWGNDLGKVESLQIVPKPWTPIAARPDGFSVWGRNVTLGPDLMPTRITHNEVPMTGEPKQTYELLSAPARLTMTAGGSPLSVGPVRTLEDKPWVLRRQVELSGSNLKGTLTLVVEFDGLMRYTLDLEPAGQGEAALDALVLELPRPADTTTHFGHGYTRTLPSAMGPYNFGALGADGLTLPFTERLWLGDDRAGIDFIAERDQWWTPMDNPRAVEIVRSQDDAAAQVLTRITMVRPGQPRPITAPIRFEWAILPTPVKPMNQEINHKLNLVQSGLSFDRETGTIDADGLRTYTSNLVAGGVNAYNMWAFGYNNVDGGSSLWNPDFARPSLRPDRESYPLRRDLLKQAVQIMHDAGMRWVLAYMLWETPIDWPNQYGVFWREMLKHPAEPSVFGYIFEPGQAFTDWYVYELDRSIREIDWDGMYQDSSAHREMSTNVYTGTGWYDDAGRLRGSYPQFANREFHKRIYVLFHQHKPDALIYSHNSHFINACVESFVDVHHAGEGSNLILDHIIGKWYAYPIGVPVTWTRWNNPVYKETRMRSWRVALLADIDLKAHPNMVLLSNQGAKYSAGRDRIYMGYDVNGEVLWWLWQAWAKYPWDGSQFLPPWRVGPIVQTGHDNVLAALHINKGKAAMLVVSSFLDEPHQANVHIDWAALGLDPATVKITDVVLETPVAATQDGVTLDIEENRWRMLYMEPGE